MSQEPENQRGEGVGVGEHGRLSLKTKLLAPVLALVVLCAALYFWRLGIIPLDDFDEAYYAEGAREMLQRGDLGTPYYNGQPFLLKPILVYWLIAAAFRLFGVTEFAARSTSAFFATLIVLETYWFAARLLNPRAGLVAGIALALCFMWVDNGREAMIDMPLTAALLPAMFLLFLGTQSSTEGRWRYYLAAYPLLGIAFLAKGPAGTFVSLAGFVCYLIWSRRLRSVLSEAYLLPGVVLFLAIAAPWYVYEAIRQPDFLGTFLLREHLGHVQGQLARDEPWYGHLKNLFIGFYPWVVFLPAAVARTRRAQEGRELLKLCSSWAGALIVAFSFAGAKLPHYLIPAFPAMAILVGGLFDEWMSGRMPSVAARRATAAALIVVGIPVSLTALVLALNLYPAVEQAYAQRYGAWRPGGSPVVMLSALGVGSFVAPLAVLGQRARLTFGALAMSVGIALFAYAGWLKPRLSLIQSQPRKELAILAGAVLPLDEPLGVYKAKRNATIFYARRPIVDLGEWEPGKLVAFLSSPSPATALTDEPSLQTIEKDVPKLSVWTKRGRFVLISNHPVSLFGQRSKPRSSG